MPTPLVVPQAGLLTLRWGLSGTLSWLNVLGIINAGNVPFTQTLANAIDSGVKAALSSTSFTAHLAPRTTLMSCSIRDIRSPNLPELVGVGAAVPGTAAVDEVLPLQVALCITLRTALAGRRFRGRVYLSGYSENQNAASGTAIATGAAVAFVTAIKTTLTSNSLDLAVVSRPQPLLPVPWVGQASVVTAVVARDSVWDTQRRRAYPGV